VFQLVTMMQGVVQRGTRIQPARGSSADRRQDADQPGLRPMLVRRLYSGLVTVVWVGYDSPATLGENETEVPSRPDLARLHGIARPVIRCCRSPMRLASPWRHGTAAGYGHDAFRRTRSVSRSDRYRIASGVRWQPARHRWCMVGLIAAWAALY